jgi:hypothetical protein
MEVVVMMRMGSLRRHANTHCTARVDVFDRAIEMGDHPWANNINQIPTLAQRAWPTPPPHILSERTHAHPLQPAALAFVSYCVSSSSSSSDRDGKAREGCQHAQCEAALVLLLQHRQNPSNVVRNAVGESELQHPC